MTRNDLIQLHKTMCADALAIMERKNSDYADDSSPFGNLDLIESLSRGSRSTEEGIIIRLGDKLSRLFTATKRGLAVNDESISDTELDMINYIILHRAKRTSRPRTPATDTK
jgi:hypothetical protein